MSRRIPPVLWVSLIALALISLLQFVAVIDRGSSYLLIGVAANIVLGIGLWAGKRWAFVLTVFFSLAGIVAAGAGGNFLGILLANGLVLVPMVLARGYFFGDAATGSFAARFCPRCGGPRGSPTAVNCVTCGAAFPIR